MRNIGPLATQAAREWRACRARGAGIADRWALVKDTARFHAGNHWPRTAVRADSRRIYRVVVGGRTIDLGLRVRAGDFFVFHEVMATAAYRLPAAWCGRIRTILDLGAHIGLTALYYLEAIPDARIICLEPAESNVALLRANLAAFGEQVVLTHGAVAPASGTARFDARHRSWAGRIAAADDAAGTPVRCYTVPELMDRAGLASVDLVKVDVEGMEQALLAGRPAWLERVNALIVELHPPYGPDEFAADIEWAGFEVFKPDRRLGNEMVCAASTRWLGQQR